MKLSDYIGQMNKKYDWNKWFAFAFLILAILGILDRIWVAEDAYITFRHIDNFFAGNGLTFNNGERVEGFTHPLWTFLLIALRFVGIPNHQGAIFLGLCFSIGGLILAYRFFQSRFDKILFLFAFLLISNSGFRDFSTSGLEFSLTFFLLTMLFIFILGREIQNHIVVFSILSLLYLTRPEMGLLLFYYGSLGIFIYLKEKDFKHIFQIVLPIILIAGSYHAFRFFYYHDIFPNTYYAKSGGESNYFQGIKYLSHTLRYSPFLIPSILIFLFSIPAFIRLGKSNHQVKFLLRDFSGLLLLMFYIVRVGGDFMAFRFFLPSIVIFTYLFQFYQNTLWASKDLSLKSTYLVNSILLVFCIYFVFFNQKIPLVKGFIVDERQVYTRGLNQDIFSRFQEIRYPWYIEGLKMKELVTCLQYKNFIITNSVTNAKCAPGLGLGYYSVAAGTNVFIIDEQGLTDKFIAKQKRPGSFRPGHERSVGLDYLIDKGVFFCSLNNSEYDENMKTRFGVIINLSPEFLFRLGQTEYTKRISKLKEIFLKTRFPTTENEKQIHSLLLKLESKYKMKILELPDLVPKEYEAYSKCW
ncbi:MAG: hypothetical protein L6Q54_01340 [Leptospiraceae bacterium]|nr:hypothetical protein [Leptospiraceae bacterium]MCK6379884.1 hypothetical protein [Leptospiraceae bacterium]NUM40235.1 hypothetical protein [Leptospiraceae bacterium]